MKILNNKDCKSDHCGTQNNISLKKIKCVIYFCSLFSILSKPYAFELSANFALLEFQLKYQVAETL